MVPPSPTSSPGHELIFIRHRPYFRVSTVGEPRYKIGNEKLVRVTERAANKLSQLLLRQGRPQGALRVAVGGVVLDYSTKWIWWTVRPVATFWLNRIKYG
jgi:hypothetical protein